MNIFLDDDDFSFFIFRLRQNLFPDKEHSGRIMPLPPQSFSLISYCLMPNHFHLLLRQNRDIPTSKLLTKVCTSYSKYFNKKHRKVGHVFQDRFKQILVDDNSYLTWLSAYIHQNPKAGGLIANLADYKWSSLGEYLNVSSDKICDKDIILSQFSQFRSELKGMLSREASYKEFVDSSFEIIKQNQDLRDLLLDHI